MSLRPYMDEHVPSAITNALRARGIDVLTVQEDGRGGTADSDVGNRAAALAKVIVSEDSDMAREATRRMRRGERFPGLFRGTELSPPHRPGDQRFGTCCSGLRAGRHRRSRRVDPAPVTRPAEDGVGRPFPQTLAPV